MREDMSGDTGNPYQAPGTFSDSQPWPQSSPEERKHHWVIQGFATDGDIRTPEELLTLLNGRVFSAVKYMSGIQATRVQLLWDESKNPYFMAWNVPVYLSKAQGWLFKIY